MVDSSRTIAVIGIGHEARGDDAVGRMVAKRIRERVQSNVVVIELDGNPTQLLDIWKNVKCAIVVDAVRARGTPGTIYRVDLITGKLPPDVHPTSSHGFGVSSVVELGRTLDQLPQRLILIGIAGEQFDAGASASPSVVAAIPEVCAMIESEINAAL